MRRVTEYVAAANFPWVQLDLLDDPLHAWAPIVAIIPR